MSSSMNIRQALKEVRDEGEKLFAAMEARGDNEFTAQERQQFDELEQRQKTLNADLDRAIRWEESAAVKFESLGLGRPAQSAGRVVTLMGRESAQQKMPGAAKINNGFGHFVRALVVGPKDCPERIRNAMSTSNNPSAGYLVPSILFPEVIDLMRARSVLAQAGMRTLIMENGEVSIAGVATDPSYGVYGENQEIAESDVTFKLTTLNALKVATLISCSRELASDAENFTELVSEVLMQSMAAQIDRYGIRGGSGFNGLELRTDVSETASVGAIQWSDINLACTEIRKSNGEPSACVMAPEIHDAVFQSLASTAGTWLGKSPNNENVQMLHSTNCTSTKVIAGDFSNLILGIRQLFRL